MNLKVNGRDYKYFTGTAVSLRYDAIASTFSTKLYFNPDNPEHRQLCQPLQYQDVVVEHEGETLITGTMLVTDSGDEPQPGERELQGYSKTGVLDDVTIDVKQYPLQSDGLSLKTITEKLLKPYGIKLIVDSSAAKLANSTFTALKADASQTIKAYICEVAAHKHILVSHDELGNLVFTHGRILPPPLFYIEDGMVNVTGIYLNVNGQDMHSSITVIRQASEDSPNAGQYTIKNPYVGIYRPKVIKQTNGTDNDTQSAARNALSAELRNIKLTINMSTWAIDGKLIRPGNLIKVKSPRNSIYNPVVFFIETVDLGYDAEKQLATLTCYLPEVYNNQTPKNIFA